MRSPQGWPRRPRSHLQLVPSERRTTRRADACSSRTAAREKRRIRGIRSWSSRLRPRSQTFSAPTRLRVGWSSRLALRPTIPARERFYADTRLARRGNAPLRQTGSTVGPVPYLSGATTPRVVVLGAQPLDRVGPRVGRCSSTQLVHVDAFEDRLAIEGILKPFELGRGWRWD